MLIGPIVALLLKVRGYCNAQARLFFCKGGLIGDWHTFCLMDSTFGESRRVDERTLGRSYHLI